MSPGYVIVLDPGTPVADEDNPAYWEEVLWFAGNLAGGSQSSEFELFTGTAMPSFAVISTFDGGGHDYFLFENPDGIVQYCAPAHCYTIYDVDATEALIPGGNQGGTGPTGSSGASGGSGGSGSSGASGGSGGSGSSGASGGSGGSGSSGPSGGFGPSGSSGPSGGFGPSGSSGGGPSDVPEPASVGLILVGGSVLFAMRTRSARKHRL